MWKLVFLALISTAFCGVTFDEDQHEGETTNPKVTTKTDTKDNPETIYKEIVEEMNRKIEFKTLKKTLENIVLNQISDILALDMTEVKQIKTMLVNKGLKPEHLSSLLKIWLGLPTTARTTTTETFTQETNVVHDTGTVEYSRFVDKAFYRRVETEFNDDKKLKEEIMKLRDVDIIDYILHVRHSATVSENLQQYFKQLAIKRFTYRLAYVKAVLAFRWNILNKKMFEVANQLSLIFKECKTSTPATFVIITEIENSNDIIATLKKVKNVCLISKINDLKTQLNEDFHVEVVEKLLEKSLTTVFMKEIVKMMANSPGRYKNNEVVINLKDLITKLPMYQTMEVFSDVCYDKRLDKRITPDEVVKVANAICDGRGNKLWDTIMSISYLYKEQLH